jgi:fumarate hydratase class II
MQVMTGSVRAFTEKCVRGLQANRPKAEAWLAQNAIVVTALNPLIGYAAGAGLVKEALKSGKTVGEIAAQMAQAGQLTHRDEARVVTPLEIEAALSDMRRLTEGGIIGGGVGG